MDTLNEIIEKLKIIKGLANINVLTNQEIEAIESLEDRENLGVREAIRRSFVLILTHTSDFRGPHGEVALNLDGTILFPPVDFKEINANNVVSSCPGIKVHEYLVKKFNLNLKDEATLIIGFDL